MFLAWAAPHLSAPHSRPSPLQKVLLLAATHLALLFLATWSALAMAQSLEAPDPGSPQAPAAVIAPPRPTPGDGQSPALRMRLMRQAFETADRNHDGRLSQEEAGAIAGLPERFGAVDANHDGVISLEEFRAAGGP